MFFKFLFETLWKLSKFFGKVSVFLKTIESFFRKKNGVSIGKTPTLLSACFPECFSFVLLTGVPALLVFFSSTAFEKSVAGLFFGFLENCPPNL